ncbi:GNAT family N-acetyltransferase [Bacillus sonorensis]|uniref:GNAT family N-acetyltransferase n=1 Tax=Bacillus sonorensis TaxID=119858 RepID=UPI0004963527|nr:GNAT family N-acetyltransferase [Bacillus sonorensis]MEC1356414.1 GNAT family N-acetyltransferase [Bacillus sonorensis]MEC1427902.1 GNAT family N-acetyltransferase [Bacillus sonorensis]MEC1589570.1 GNAT family N-acetyltransferase [Bacillus sonorensis]
MDTSIIQLTNDEEHLECMKEMVELWNRNAVETANCELDEEEKKAVQEQIQQYIQSTYGVVFAVTNEKSRAVGFGIASMKQDLVSNTLYGQIDEIYVSPRYRRQNIAGNLVDDIMNWFKRKDVSFVHVSVDIENQTALKFWQGIGNFLSSPNTDLL